MALEDSVLIEGIKNGNKKAFDKLVIKYQYKVFKLLLFYTHDSSEVLDLTQETFMKVFNKLDQFQGNSSFYSWLCRIAVNTAKNHKKHEERRPPLIDIDVVESEKNHDVHLLNDDVSPEHLLLRDEINKTVNKAVAHLPKSLYLTLLLHEKKHFNYHEIAALMKCPVGTVRSRICRARFIISECIKNLL